MSKRMKRRDFLLRAGHSAALVGAGVALASAAAAKTEIPPTDPHQPKTGRLLNPEETIGLGVIGTGGMGGSHIEELCQRELAGAQVQVRAVCDAYAKRRLHRKTWIQENTGREVEDYLDYKELLSRDDIHGIIVATPDHWHAQISLDALDAGKDVYCQKPVTYTIEESLAVRDKVLETGRIFQCGAQQSSDDFWWLARDFIKQGGIGKVLWAQADYSRNSATGPDQRGGEWNWKSFPDATDDPNSGERYIDWERWLGPAPKRPFSRARFFQFRKYWDYSGGVGSDLLYHVLAPLTIALDAQAPEKAVASGGIFVQHDDREVPDTFAITLDYPDDYTISLTSCLGNTQGNATLIRGHKATIRPHAEGMQVTPEREFKEWFAREFGAEDLVVQNRPRLQHMDIWLEAMRTRGAVHLDAETAYRAMAGIKMGIDSYRQEEVVFWDGAKECYTDTHPRPNRISKLPAEPEPIG